MTCRVLLESMNRITSCFVSNSCCKTIDLHLATKATYLISMRPLPHFKYSSYHRQSHAHFRDYWLKYVAYTKSEMASQFTATAAANVHITLEWVMPGKPSLTSGFHNDHFTSLVCEGVGVKCLRVRCVCREGGVETD